MPRNPFRYFKTSPEIIQLAVMMYVRFPLSLRNVEDLLHERGIDICHETVRHWGDLFDYYVFENGPEVREHIPEHGRGILDPMTPERAGKIRSFLLRMLTNE